MPRRSPFDQWPTEDHDPRYGYRWYREPAVLIDCITVAHGTVETVRAMHASLDRFYVAHARQIEAAGGLQIIGDWRCLKSYDPEARQMFLAEMRKPRPIRGTVVVLDRAGAFLRMAVQAARMVSSVAGGPSIAVSEDIDAVLRQYGVHATTRRSLPPPMGQ